MHIDMSIEFYLVGPRTRDTGKFLHAPAQLDVLVGSEQVFQAMFNVRHDPGQRLTTHDDTWAAHAEVFVVLEAEQPKFLLVAASSLSHEYGPPAVNRPEQRL